MSLVECLASADCVLLFMDFVICVEESYHMWIVFSGLLITVVVDCFEKYLVTSGQKGLYMNWQRISE